MRRPILIAAAAALAFVGGAKPVAADMLPDGHRSLDVRVRMDWGPLAGHLSRPVVPRADDSWESLAKREAGDARWAPTIRAMTGRDAPATGDAPAWLPPRDLAFGPKATWWSAYVDSSKYGRESDISRTGFDRVDPAASTRVFGTVTFAVRRHGGPEDAARVLAAPQDIVARPKAAGFAVASSFSVPMSVERDAALRRIEQSWRVESADEESLRLALVSEARFDAEGRPLADGFSLGMPIAVVLGAAAVLVAAVLARRATRPPPA